MRKLYGDDWFGAVTLVGVDVQARRAILRLESGAPPKLALATDADRDRASAAHDRRASRLARKRT